MDLELYTDKALIEELVRRFDNVVFVGEREHPTDSYEYFRHSGKYRVCQGLCFGMIERINKTRLDNVEEVDGD